LISRKIEKHWLENAVLLRDRQLLR